MNRVELKNWAKQKIKGHIWEILIPVIVAGILSGITVGQKFTMEGGILHYNGGISLGIFFYFVQVGLASFMVKFVNEKKCEFKELFAYINDYVRIFLTAILEIIFVFLWTLLLIVPGIIKAFSYALVDLLLADSKYNDLECKDILKKSQEMMNGHKMDLFIFELSFIGWHILAIFTLGLLEIWIIPYYTTAKYKFLDDIKKSNESSK